MKIFEKATGWKSQMWGPSIIGYGRYSYVYESGHHGDACVVGFSPRKGAVVLYLGSGTPEAKALLAKLGKLKTDGGCIYVNKLADIDLAVLEKYVKVAQAASLKNYKDRNWPVSADLTGNRFQTLIWRSTTDPSIGRGLFREVDHLSRDRRRRCRSRAAPVQRAQAATRLAR